MDTQDQVNEKSIAIVIKGGKISAKVLAKAIMLLLKQGKKQIDKANAPKIGKGKQSVKDLVKHGAGVTNIEITDAMTAAFKEFTTKAVKRTGPEKPSLLNALKQAKELAAKLVVDKVKHKDRGMEL